MSISGVPRNVFILLLLILGAVPALAHPGDGIVVDAEGTIYFVARKGESRRYNA